MKAWQGCAGALLGLGLGCGGAPEAKSARERLPENIVLRVDRVDVAIRRNGAQNWDPPVAEPQSNAVCSLLAIGTNLVSPVSGDDVEELCGALVRPEHRERFPHDPDLRLRLSAGASVSFDSPITPDADGSHSFAYEFVVPTSAVPADGIRIEVLDDDGKDGAQSVGVARLTLETLAKAYESPTRMHTAAAGSVLRLEVVVSPYAPMEFDKRRVLATFDPHPIGSRRLVAGEIVHLRAEGSYKVGDWYDALLGPKGYTGDVARKYNFKQEPFVNAPHATGIALAGQKDVFVGALVAPCVTFTSLYAGELRVGLNDTEPKNNEGWISFEGFSRAPTVEEWGRPLNIECR
jgi:hypothetical protein